MEQPFISLERAKTQVNEIVDDAYAGFEKRVFSDPGLVGAGSKPISDLRKPAIAWKKLGFGIAGRTRCESNIIEMNINYLYSRDYDRFIRYTSLHELAHSIAFQLFDDARHDGIWRNIDRLLGGGSSCCHDYARPINAPKKLRYIYECPRCGTIFRLSERRNKTVFDGTYRCMKCKTNLLEARFVEKTFL